MHRLIAVGALILCAIVGCSPNPMVGVWKLRLPDTKDPRLLGTRGEAVFLRDDTFTMTFKTKLGEAETTFVLKGRFQLDGHDLVLQVEEATADGIRQPDKEDTTLKIRLSDDMKSFGHPSVSGARFIRE